MAIRYSADHILDYIELDESCSIFEVSVPKEWIGKSILQIDMRKKYNVNIIAIKENGKINAIKSIMAIKKLNKHNLFKQKNATIKWYL